MAVSFLLIYALFIPLLDIVMELHIGHKLAVFFFAYLFMSMSQALLVEPRNDLDQLLHVHGGKLPDLTILEDQEPVDAILQWAKTAAKDHHPIVREQIYLDIIEKTCLEIQYVQCRRRRAWEHIDMGTITAHGLKYEIEFINPAVDPKMRPGTKERAVENTAAMVCQRIVPPLADCKNSLMNHISNQLSVFETKRLDNKNVYTKLSLEMDAPHEEIFPVAASMIRSRGTNISPYKRIDNGTLSYHMWDKNTVEAFHIMDAYRKVKDYQSREWYDKPCTPYFGGALCAKTDKDGNMIIEV
jgi:hypothetical protein